MKIDYLFPTPLYQHDADESETALILPEITSVVEKEKAEIKTREDARARSYLQSRDIAHRQVIYKYKMEHFHRFLLIHSKAFLKQLHPDAKGMDIRESWFNFYQPGDYQELHNHTHFNEPSFLSGVFYLLVPENSGDIKFYQPNLNTTVTGHPNAIEQPEVVYPAIEHRLYLFRSHVPHSVLQNRSKAQRISVSFNIYVV